MRPSTWTVLWVYRYFLAVYALLLSACLWICGAVSLWDTRFSTEVKFSLEIATTLALAALSYAWGRGWKLRSASLAELPVDLIRPWIVPTLLLGIFSWLGFVGVLAAHHFPTESFGFAWRALLVTWTLEILFFWFGLAAREYGDRWNWLLPTIVMASWVGGRLFQNGLGFYTMIEAAFISFKFHEVATGILEMAHTPVALLLGLSLAGIAWYHKFPVNRFAPLFFAVPIMVIGTLALKIQRTRSAGYSLIPKMEPTQEMIKFLTWGTLKEPVDMNYGKPGAMKVVPSKPGSPKIYTSPNSPYRWTYTVATPAWMTANWRATSVSLKKTTQANEKGEVIRNVRYLPQFRVMDAARFQLELTEIGALPAGGGAYPFPDGIRLQGRLEFTIQEECGRLPIATGSALQLEDFNAELLPTAELTPSAPNEVQLLLRMRWDYLSPLPMISGAKDGFFHGTDPAALALDFRVEGLGDASYDGPLTWKSPNLAFEKSWLQTSEPIHYERIFLPLLINPPDLSKAQLIIRRPAKQVTIPFDLKLAVPRELLPRVEPTTAAE